MMAHFWIFHGSIRSYFKDSSIDGRSVWLHQIIDE